MNTDKIFAEALINEYSPKNESKVIALRKLDKKAKSSANIFAYTFGIVTCLIFGTGMCFGMKVVGPATVESFVLGIIIGIIGMTGMAINYPIYKKLLEKGKQKYAYEVIELAKDICESEK